MAGPMNAFDEEQMMQQGGGMPPGAPQGMPMPPMPPQGGAPMPQQAGPQLPPQLLEQIMQLMQGAQGAYDQTVPGPAPQQEEGGEGHVCPTCGSKC